jgi:hypothetical protein
MRGLLDVFEVVLISFVTVAAVVMLSVLLRCQNFFVSVENAL